MFYCFFNHVFCVGKVWFSDLYHYFLSLIHPWIHRRVLQKYSIILRNTSKGNKIKTRNTKWFHLFVGFTEIGVDRRPLWRFGRTLAYDTEGGGFDTRRDFFRCDDLQPFVWGPGCFQKVRITYIGISTYLLAPILQA